MEIKKISLNIGIIIGVALSIFAVTFLVVAWTGPTAAPPSGNLPAPLSAGSGTEYKGGALGIGGLFETDTSTHLAVSGGNVGIGTTSPGARLEVSSIGADGIDISADTETPANSGRLFFSTGTAGQSTTLINVGGDLRFSTGGTPGSSTGTSRLTIKSDGSVGIGTITPDTYSNQAKLVVDGGVALGNAGNGRHVYGWYAFGYHGTGYHHIKTSMWAGGSPSGNINYIMGGWHIKGYRYSSSGTVDSHIYFHNWGGGYFNKSIVHNGSWSPNIDIYTSSDGYVVLRIETSSYSGFIIDLHQFYTGYSTRDIRIISTANSSSTSHY